MNDTAFNQSKENIWLSFDKLILVIIAIAPIFSLIIKGWINGCIFLLFFLCTYSLIAQKNIGSKKINRLVFLGILVLASNFLLVLIAQLFHEKIALKSFDAPLRILLCIPIFLFLLKNKTNVEDLFRWTLPLTLITTFFYLYLNKGYYWGERAATSYSDPNALGSYIVCILGLTMLTIQRKGFHIFYDLFYWVLWSLSIFVGFYIAIQAGTRGSFLAIPIIVFAFVKSLSVSQKNKFLLLGLIISLLILTSLINSYFQARIFSGYLEIHQWFNGSQTESSAGYRLSMFKLSIELISQKLLAGYGEFGYKEYLMNITKAGDYSAQAIQIMMTAGPHSTLFETTLNYGLIGLLGYIFLMFAPIYIFYKSKLTSKWRGICFILSMLIMGQSIHIFTLKYTSSLFGLLLAWLLSDVIKENQT
jgi:O-antigen ligase